MDALDAQQSPTTHAPRTALRTSLFLFALALAACSPRSTDAKAAKVAEAEQQGSSDSEGAKGVGHLHISGDVAKDADFAVDGCQIGKPGQGLLDGYRMHAEDGDSTVIMLSVLLRDFVKDGPYTADTSASAQLNEGMSSGNFGPLSIMLAGDNAASPLAFKLTPASSLVITISDNGSKGKAEMVKMESQPGVAEIMATRNGSTPHGKTVSGTVTWSCGHIDHLNGEMTKAVNGMFDKLMPAR